MLTSWPPSSSSSQPWLLHSEEVASETPEASSPAGKQLKNSEQTKTEHCSQWIDPGLVNQLIRIFAMSFSKLQNIDKLLLALREAWNKGIRDYKNKPKQMENKKKGQEKTKHAISWSSHSFWPREPRVQSLQAECNQQETQWSQKRRSKESSEAWRSTPEQ